MLPDPCESLSRLLQSFSVESEVQARIIIYLPGTFGFQGLHMSQKGRRSLLGSVQRTLCIRPSAVCILLSALRCLQLSLELSDTVLLV